MTVESGLAALTADVVQGRNIGVVTNHTGLDRHFRRTADVVVAAGGRVGALFGGEHGIDGLEAEGATIASDTRVYSLYNPDDPNPYAPPPGSLDGLDALLFDMQDVGLRYYTYPTTLGILLETVDLPIYVVDRPNPLGGVEIEGARLDPAFVSFVGRYPIPIRHGLTLGELARYINIRFLNRRADLHILPMSGWQRTTPWEASGLAWVAPSPNLPSIAAVRVYGGTCLLEGTNVSVGRGTTLPFEQTGAPYITDPERLAAEMMRLERPGVTFRATRFKPFAGLYAGQVCGGVQLHLTAPATPTHIVRIGLRLVQTIARLYPDAFDWRPAHFDRLIGSDAPRRTIEVGNDLSTIFDTWTTDEAAFADERAAALLYRT